jgi:hypothetical protein
MSTGPSIAKKVGILGRVVTQQALRSRRGGALLKAARTTASHFGHVLGQLWLEVTGFVFLSLAGIGAIAFTREYMKYQAGTPGAGSRVAIAVGFTALFGWFGVSSFWKIRKRG